MPCADSEGLTLLRPSPRTTQSAPRKAPAQSLKFVPISPTSLGCRGDGIDPSRDSAGLHQPRACTSRGQGKSQP